MLLLVRPHELNWTTRQPKRNLWEKKKWNCWTECTFAKRCDCLIPSNSFIHSFVHFSLFVCLFVCLFVFLSLISRSLETELSSQTRETGLLNSVIAELNEKMWVWDDWWLIVVTMCQILDGKRFASHGRWEERSWLSKHHVISTNVSGTRSEQHLESIDWLIDWCCC